MNEIKKMEEIIVKSLVNELIKNGFTLSVHNGGDKCEIIKSSDPQAVLAVMFQTDEEHLLAHKKGYRNFVHLVYGNCGYDVMCDYGTSLEQHFGETIELSIKLEEESENEDNKLSWLDKYIEEQNQPASELIATCSANPQPESNDPPPTPTPAPGRKKESLTHYGWSTNETAQVCLLMRNDWNYYKEIADLEECPDELFNYRIIVNRLGRQGQLNEGFRRSQVNAKEVIQEARDIWKSSRGIDQD